jgi:antirestriction protein ArdC
MNTERQDIYTRVTAKIIASLEQGVRPLDETVERR